MVCPECETFYLTINSLQVSQPLETENFWLAGKDHSRYSWFVNECELSL